MSSDIYTPVDPNDDDAMNKIDTAIKADDEWPILDESYSAVDFSSQPVTSQKPNPLQSIQHHL
jgi:hypothetical protein